MSQSSTPRPTPLSTLTDAVRVLAAPASEQLDHLRRLGVLPSVDELALEFDDAFPPPPQLAASGFISPEAQGHLEALSHMLEKMSGYDPEWETPALEDSPAWAEVRRLAQLALDGETGLIAACEAHG